MQVMAKHNTDGNVHIAQCTVIVLHAWNTICNFSNSVPFKIFQ